MEKMQWDRLLSYHISGKKNLIQGSSAVRSAFERDYDRIIFSYPFRRLQDKTQVFPMPEHDFVHSRLTHSLEVSSVGRTLGKKVGEKIVEKYPHLASNGISQFDFGAIVAAASLTHDIGNPPFGHAGEDAISDFFLNNPAGQFFKDKISRYEWADITSFEGNAQGFRILNKQHNQGLQITYATLMAFSKYPRESLITYPADGQRSLKKYGFFQSEKHIFETIATQTGLLRKHDDQMIWARHPLAFLVEAADDICYNIIDLEDGCRLGLVSFEEAKPLLTAILQEQFNAEKFDQMYGRDEKLGLLRALAIGKLIEQATEIFLENEEKILAGTFDTALTDLITAKPVLDKINKLSIEKIYRATVVMETEVAAFEVLAGLLEAFIGASYAYCFDKANFSKKKQGVLRLLPEEYQFLFQPGQSPTVYQIIMNSVDYVASMTDSYAILLYRKIKGISLPGK